MAERINRRGLRNREQNPKSKRSAVRRLGARRRDRCRTRSCCFKSRFSARTARVPPDPRRAASPASSCTSNIIAFFMGKQLERHWLKGQGSRIAAAGAPQLRIRHVQGENSANGAPGSLVPSIYRTAHRDPPPGVFGSSVLLDCRRLGTKAGVVQKLL